MTTSEQEAEYFKYLNRLQASSVTNMHGAGAYLERVFSLDRDVADDILQKWMDTYEERHPL